MSVGASDNKTVVRKNLHSMHEDLSNWSKALQNMEVDENPEHPNSALSFSIHQSIKNFSDNYRPLSLSFQQWQNSSNVFDHVVGEVNRIEFPHEEITVLAQNLQAISTSELNQKAGSGSEFYVNKSFSFDDKSHNVTFSPLSKVSNDESFADPFSANLDVVLDSEEQTLYFNYSGTPPNSLSRECLNTSTTTTTPSAAEKNLQSVEVKRESLLSVPSRSSKKFDSSSDQAVYDENISINSKDFDVEELNISLQLSDNQQSESEKESIESTDSLRFADDDQDSLNISKSSTVSTCVKKDYEVSNEIVCGEQEKENIVPQKLDFVLGDSEVETPVLHDKPVNKEFCHDSVVSTKSADVSSSSEDDEIGVERNENKNSYVTYEDGFRLVEESVFVETEAKPSDSENDLLDSTSDKQLTGLPTQTASCAVSASVVVNSVNTKSISDIEESVEESSDTNAHNLETHTNDEILDSQVDEAYVVEENENISNLEQTDNHRFVESSVELAVHSEPMTSDDSSDSSSLNYTMEVSNQMNSEQSYDVVVVEKLSIKSESNDSDRHPQMIVVEENQATNNSFSSDASFEAKHPQTSHSTEVEKISTDETELHNSRESKTVYVEEMPQIVDDLPPPPKFMEVEEEHSLFADNRESKIETFATEEESTSPAAITTQKPVSPIAVAKLDDFQLQEAEENSSLDEKQSFSHSFESNSSGNELNLDQVHEVTSEKIPEKSEIAVNTIQVKTVQLKPLTSPMKKILNGDLVKEKNDDFQVTSVETKSLISNTELKVVKKESSEQHDRKEIHKETSNVTNVFTFEYNHKEKQRFSKMQLQGNSSNKFERNSVNVSDLIKSRASSNDSEPCQENNVGKKSPDQSSKTNQRDLPHKSKVLFEQKKKMFETSDNSASTAVREKSNLRQTSHIQSTMAKLFDSADKNAACSQKRTSNFEKNKIFTETSDFVTTGSVEKTAFKLKSPRPLFTAKPFKLATNKPGHVAPPTLGVKDKTRMFQQTINSATSSTSPPSVFRKSHSLSVSSQKSSVSAKTSVSTKTLIDNRPPVPPLPSPDLLNDDENLSAPQLVTEAAINDLKPPPIPDLPDSDSENVEFNSKDC